MKMESELYIDVLCKKTSITKKVLQKKLELFFRDGDRRKEEIIEELCSVNVKMLCDNSTAEDQVNQIILFCVIKNEYGRIDRFLDYYRSIGINRFVFLDNDSDDGTKEYLLEQKDVVLYSATVDYSSVRRVAWINYLLLLHGINKWCVVVDSDEYLSYIGSERFTLEKVITVAESKNLKRIEGVLLDMYPRGELFCDYDDPSGFIERNVFFDHIGYELKMWKHGFAIKGGPRKRVFSCNVYLSKYPLFYFGDEDFYANSHYLSPDDAERKYPVWIALRHYKFLDEKDLKKIEIAVMKENYFRESEEYKIYLHSIQNNGCPSFYNVDYSAEFVSSDSLRKICFLEAPFDSDI